MDTQATATRSSSDQIDRVSYLLRRATAWVTDGLVIMIPLLAVGFGSALFTWIAIGGSFALSGGGAEGLIAGSAAGMVTVLLTVVVVPIALVGVPAFYLRWAVHRP